MSPFQPCPLPTKDPVNCADLALPPGMFPTSHLAPVAKSLLQVQTMFCVQLPISCPCDTKLPLASRGCFMLDETLGPCVLSPDLQARFTQSHNQDCPLGTPAPAKVLSPTCPRGTFDTPCASAALSSSLIQIVVPAS